MKLIKLSEDHFIVVDDSDKLMKGGPCLVDGGKGRVGIDSYQTNVSYTVKPLKITYSTKPLEGVSTLDLSQVKELIGEVDVEKKAKDDCYNRHETYNSEYIHAYIKGYSQRVEETKDKRFTEEDLRVIIAKARTFPQRTGTELIQSLQPKTEWEVEFVDGKLKLK